MLRDHDPLEPIPARYHVRITNRGATMSYWEIFPEGRDGKPDLMRLCVGDWAKSRRQAEIATRRWIRRQVEAAAGRAPRTERWVVVEP